MKDVISTWIDNSSIFLGLLSSRVGGPYKFLSNDLFLVATYLQRNKRKSIMEDTKISVEERAHARKKLIDYFKRVSLR